MAGPTIVQRFKAAFNAFVDRSPLQDMARPNEMSYTRAPHRTLLNYGHERSIVTAVFVRVAVDVASLKIRHVRVDDNDSYVETISSNFNRCLSLEANIDQTNRALIQDAMMSMFDDGVVAIVPVDTTVNINDETSFDILTLRTGKIIEWYPTRVRVELYNDRIGQRQQITLPKSSVAIIENPLYAVMNEPNSTLQRLISKLNILDAIDKQSGSGKLDLIIQVPYAIKNELRRQMAETRRTDMENQLANTKYGVAYADATEKVIQLNRPVENNLMTQIEYLTRMLYSQLGMTESIFDGTADEATMNNYYSRTIEPCITALTGEMKRKFLTQTAITQGQSVMHFRNSFALATSKDIADLADKMTRNAILSSNEVRSFIGFKPSKQPGADDLTNKNLNQPTPGTAPNNTNVGDNQNGTQP